MDSDHRVGCFVVDDAAETAPDEFAVQTQKRPATFVTVTGLSFPHLMLDNSIRYSSVLSSTTICCGVNIVLHARSSPMRVNKNS